MSSNFFVYIPSRVFEEALQCDSLMQALLFDIPYNLGVMEVGKKIHVTSLLQVSNKSLSMALSLNTLIVFGVLCIRKCALKWPLPRIFQRR